MNWQKILNSHPDRHLHFPDGSISYRELAVSLKEIRGEIIWNGPWSKEGVVTLLSAVQSGANIIIGGESQSLPQLSGIEKNIFLRSSGTMGPSKWLSHPTEVLLTLEPLYHGKKVALLLRPSHAAGIETFFAGLSGGNDLYFPANVRALKSMIVDGLHGPPAILAYLLNFRETFKTFLSHLSVFYNGTDVLHEALVEKKIASQLNFHIEQVYGSTETWRLKTETHPLRGDLFRFTDPRVELSGKAIYVSGISMGDDWEQVENEWGRLVPRRIWVANFYGAKVNLFDLENRFLNVSGVAEVAMTIHPGLLGPEVQVEVQVLTGHVVTEKDLLPLVDGPPAAYHFSFVPNKEPELIKRKRPGSV